MTNEIALGMKHLVISIKFGFAIDYGLPMPLTSQSIPIANALEMRSHTISMAILELSEADAENRGAIFTNPKVVTFMLDLIGYTRQIDLTKCRILEPSFGAGDFLLQAIERLLDSYEYFHQNTDPVLLLQNCIKGVELHRVSAQETKIKIASLLQARGISLKSSETLTDSWITQDDFLLTPITNHFTHIIGNPPYIRQELIASDLLQAYKSHYKTLYDRADIYIPFIERCLSLLEADGQLSFICSDRWMKNRYGFKLRQFVSENFHVKHYVDMVGTQAFQRDVAAYTAITTFVKTKGEFTSIAKRPHIETKHLTQLSKKLNSTLPTNETELIQNALKGGDPWLLDCALEHNLIRELESNYVSLEKAGCKVGIGVASGCDSVYIAPYDELDVEPARKLPIALAKDTSTGELIWGGKGIINPFESDGRVVNPEEYPQFNAFLSRNKQAILARYVSRKNPTHWFRTIDRIYPKLVTTPKLLIPDIKDKPTVVFDYGTVYPHHNLCWILSKSWDLRALQTVLRSDIARLFVWAYSVKMRGGWLRFQAQNLRRICLPNWESVEQSLKSRLIDQSSCQNRILINELIYELYDLTDRQISIIEELE